MIFLFNEEDRRRAEPLLHGRRLDWLDVTADRPSAPRRFTLTTFHDDVVMALILAGLGKQIA
jgi:hypothetical protein